MIQVIGIPMGSDPAPLFANLFLAHKEADWVTAQCKLGTINVREINNSFLFIDDLPSLNDGSTFEKHYKDIYPTVLGKFSPGQYSAGEFPPIKFPSSKLPLVNSHLVKFLPGKLPPSEFSNFMFLHGNET